MRKTAGIFAIHALVGCGFVLAQVIVSSILGHVTDPSGASVPGARITVTNTQTGVSVQTVTGSEGTYSVPGLLAGTYDVTVEKSGLQTFEAKGIPLFSSRDLRLAAVRRYLSAIAQIPRPYVAA